MTIATERWGWLRCLLFVLLAAAMVALGTSASEAQTRRPLIIDGTQSIYERALTRPGAALFDVPDGTQGAVYPAFQPLYVFARQDGWVEVGPSINSAPEGWVKEESVVAWKQNIVGAFTNPAGRSRQLLFDTEENLRWLMNHEALRDVQARFVAEADAGSVDPDSGVISVEPGEFVNIREELYIMPILEAVEDLHPLTYEDMLVMQVASIPKRDESLEGQMVEDGEGGTFDVGIVFVLDTTQSMDPFIERTRRVVQNTVQQIAGTEIGDLVNFGVIGFRDNVDAVPGLEYRTKVQVPLERRSDESEVIEGIATLETARVNSPGFNEDSLAGVEDAIDTMDWDQTNGDGDPIDARYVILITDAGPKDPRDPNARSAIGPVELQRDAEGRNLVVMTLHLKTPAGEGTHDYAAARYRELSRFAGREFYFPIEGGSEDAFEGVATRLVTALTDHVRAVRGESTVLQPEDAGEDLVELGRAMQLAWLGSQRNTQAPDLIKGWLSDLAVEKPQALAIEPRLLVTKNEMATLAVLLRDLKASGEASQDSDDVLGFFDDVQRVIADLATNPDIMVNADADTLGGALEYLDRLPYKSQVLGMTRNRWAEGAMVRRSIIDGMGQKLAQYRKWLEDADVWTALYEGAPDGEHVFAMPFDVLP